MMQPERALGMVILLGNHFQNESGEDEHVQNISCDKAPTKAPDREVTLVCHKSHNRKG